MRLGCAIALGGLITFGNAAVAGDALEVPPEVTPKLRAACESDVRRLCIGDNPTVAKVKSCVARKFLQLGRRCQVELASVGFRP